MATSIKPDTQATPAASYSSILLAVDSSDYSNRATSEARAIASLCGAKVTATHVYAAKMHDLRFRQMEGGLPDEFRVEQELERQRDVHDDLITRGLSIITDSYLDQAERACETEGIEFRRCALEGKNYRALIHETNSGRYDLLVMGALGLGAIPGSRIGTVCRRVVRRSDIDTLIIKEPQRSLADGPIMVAVDGSDRAFGGLLTALSLARHWQVPVHVVAAFDPYYHYVAFKRIAGVLDEEASKVFRFKEQERLHEEIIDSGLAKIYQAHLTVAQTVAAEYDAQVETRLLDGKPHDAIEKYLRQVKPTLLVVGKVGIHADPDLDIGGNSEALLHNAGCAVLLSQRRHQPRVDIVADVTTSWTHEAERRLERVPGFVRNMARMAILRFAQERGHTVITERIVEEATAQLMPAHAEQLMADIVAAHDTGPTTATMPDEAGQWSPQAKTLLGKIEGAAVRDNVAKRAEKRARSDGAAVVGVAHVQAFISEPDLDCAVSGAESGLHWQAGALARLARVPEGFMRDAAKQRIEKYARDRDCQEIDLAVAEQGLAAAREAMEAALPPAGDTDPGRQTKPHTCPVVATAESMSGSPEASRPAAQPRPQWTAAAARALQAVPEGYCRDMTVKAAETIAAQQELREIDTSFVTGLMETFKSGAVVVVEELSWDNQARQRVGRAPPMVRGMLVKEIEGWVRRCGRDRVDASAVEAVKQEWQSRGVFHLDPDDPRNL